MNKIAGVISKIKTIDYSRKPRTLLVSAIPMGVAMALGIFLSIWMAISLLVQTVSDASGLLLITLPLSLGAVIFLSAQIVSIVVLGYVVLRGVYHWSKVSIILAAFGTPLALVIVASSLAMRMGYFMFDASTAEGVVGLVLFFVIIPFATLLIAYDDIKYRYPKNAR